MVKGSHVIHHASFNVHEPERAAAVLAQMLGAEAVRAPFPPFPRGAWFVCLGDANGSLLEIMPWGETRDSAAPRGVGFDPAMRATSGAHVLMSTTRSSQALFDIAAGAGWRAETADAGFFRFIKVWVENAFLVEFLTPEFKDAYVASFDAAGVRTIDAQFRELETALGAKL